MGTDVATQLLLAACRGEVTSRHCIFVEDDNTRTMCRLVAGVFASDAVTNRLGFILCGRPGNGKSTLLLAFQRVVNALADRNMFPTDPMDNCPRKPGVRIIDAREVAEASSSIERLNELAREPFLGIDDMGTEAAQTMSYGNVYRPMTDLLEKRYAYFLPTAISTNLTPPEIRERYGDRVADRFTETMEVIAFKAPSFRSAGAATHREDDFAF